MPQTISLAARTTVPAFYSAEERDRQIPDQIHADIGVSLALAVESIRASSLGSAARAALLLGYAESALLGLGSKATLYHADLAALHHVLIGGEVAEELAVHSSDRARADARAAAVDAQWREPHPWVLEWLLHRAVSPGLQREAVLDAREHLLSYGIDPTAPTALDELTARRHAGEWVPQRQAQGHVIYSGNLNRKTGYYLCLDMTTPLAELLDAATPLSEEEVDLLARARALDPAIQPQAWEVALAELLRAWIARISSQA